METIQLHSLVEQPIYAPDENDFQEALPGLFEYLRKVIIQLGKGGGYLTPSIYDTAQVLRFAPPEEGVELGLDWLIEQQNSDGGWGNPVAPFMRDVPTLATVLALHQYNHQGRFSRQIQDGINFLQQQSLQWQEFSHDDLLVGVEMILPALVTQAMDQGLNITFHPYMKLMKIGGQKKKMIQHMKIVHGTPAAFSWEAWGEHPDKYLLDTIHSVGNSPSATAGWIAKARQNDKDVEINESMNYLRLASKVTGLDIPGVVPFAWPINRFEQSFGLYPLALGKLMHHLALRDDIKTQVRQLSEALTPYGMPFSDHFIPDLDDTAATAVVLHTFGMNVDSGILNVFKHPEGFFTYPREFHASTSAHARAIHALSLMDTQTALGEQRVLFQFQNPNGIWPGDKWHKSWLYTTSHMLYALSISPYLTEVEKGLRILVESQNEDGGWGIGQRSTTSETAYVLLALNLYLKEKPYLEVAYRRGQAWLFSNLGRPIDSEEHLWIGKELFKPYRIDRAFELTALIQAFLTPQSHTP